MISSKAMIITQQQNSTFLESRAIFGNIEHVKSEKDTSDTAREDEPYAFPVLINRTGNKRPFHARCTLAASQIFLEKKILKIKIIKWKIAGGWRRTRDPVLSNVGCSVDWSKKERGKILSMKAKLSVHPINAATNVKCSVHKVKRQLT